MGSPLANLISGLILAALSGLTVVAYRHPDGYMRIWGVVSATWSVIVTVLVVWNVTLSFAFLELKPFIDKTKIDKAKAAIDGSAFTNPYVWLGGIAVSAYLVFLAYLPRILGKDDKPDGER